MKIWKTIVAEIDSKHKKGELNDLFLAQFYREVFLTSSSLAQAVATVISAVVHIPPIIKRDLLKELLWEKFAQKSLIKKLSCDMTAIYERDPACQTYYTTLLHYKGFYALCLHRVAHQLALEGRNELAFMLNMISCQNFTIDIHPRAQLSRGIFIDHGNSIVIGETAVVAEDVSILQDVTLGGTGKASGDRHPKIDKGVLIGAGAKILGNIRIGAYCKVGAGSVVLKDIPAYATVAGVPAQIVKVDYRPSKRKYYPIPAKEMDHFIALPYNGENSLLHPPTTSQSPAHSPTPLAPLAPLVISIDIGSNTIMMTIAEKNPTATANPPHTLKKNLAHLAKHSKIKIQPEGTWTLAATKWRYYDFIRFARLAESFNQAPNKKIIKKAAVLRGETILHEYRAIINSFIKANKENSPPPPNPKTKKQPHSPSYQPNIPQRNYRIKVTATSALREAENSDAVKLRLETALAAPIEIISAEREAELTFLGASAALTTPRKPNRNNPSPPKKTKLPNMIAILDIGGGSTEIGWGDSSGFRYMQGFTIGAITWQKLYPHAQLRKAEQRKKLRATLTKLIAKESHHQPLPSTLRKLRQNQSVQLIGVAGVPTTLAALQYQLTKDTLPAIDGKTLHQTAITALEEELAATSLRTLLQNTNRWEVLDPNRAKIILFSTIALQCFMEHLQVTHLDVSIRGLRYGTLRELQAL